jgi:transcriptional regulator with XRE-family HTH domain
MIPLYNQSMENDFGFFEDLTLIEPLLGLGKSELAKQLGTSAKTLFNWETGRSAPSLLSLEAFYSYVYQRGIRLNDIKAQLYQEDNPGLKILFHGSKAGIEGPLSLDRSQPSKDFGKGFYCEESLEQSISFVSAYPQSSAYVFAFDDKGLSKVEFGVDQTWMMAIAYYRGRLQAYRDHPLIQALTAQVVKADYILAPIADNRMFEIITEFIDGEITDEQCKHCLLATDLGKQYVIISDKALAKVRQLGHCYLSRLEKADSAARRDQLLSIGADKVKIARAKYRGQDHYIGEILA